LFFRRVFQAQMDRSGTCSLFQVPFQEQLGAMLRKFEGFKDVMCSRIEDFCLFLFPRKVSTVLVFSVGTVSGFCFVSRKAWICR
jgi:hypothetical protein